MLCDVETLLIDSTPGDDLECELNVLKEEASSITTAVFPAEAGLAGNVNVTFFAASVDCWVRASLSSRDDEPTAVAGRLVQP